MKELKKWDMGDIWREAHKRATEQLKSFDKAIKAMKLKAHNE